MDITTHLQSLSREQWNQLFDLIEPISKTKSFSKWKGGKYKKKEGVIEFPYEVHSDVIRKVIGVIQDLQLSPNFDWSHWPEGRALVDKEAFETMDGETICKLFTVMIRADRFVEGLMS